MEYIRDSIGRPDEMEDEILSREEYIDENAKLN